MKRLAAVLTLLGCSWGTVSPDDFKKEFGISPSSGGKPELNVMSASGMSQCIAKLRATVGESDVHATELTFHTTYVSLSARSPAHPENVDSYECRYGEVGPSKPVKLGSAAKTLEQDTFAFSDIDFDGLPDRIDRTVTELALEGGMLSYVDVRKRDGSSGRYVSVTVRVTGARRDSTVEFDGKGNKVAHDVAATSSSSGSGPLNRANLATATLPLDKWVALDAPEIPRSGAFDPLMKLDWAISIATLWKSDATLYYLRANHPSANGLINLNSDWCQYWFISAACLAAGQGRCGFNLLVDGATSSPPGVNVSVTNASARQPVSAATCTLRDAIAALDKHNHGFTYDNVDLGITDSKAVWTFNHNAVTTDDMFTGKVTRDPGNKLAVNVATCLVTSK